jgi:hypothetical protein
MEPRGIYKERNGWGDQHSARVRYDEHQELEMSESRYRERDYKPPFDELPWKDKIESRRLGGVLHNADQEIFSVKSVTTNAESARNAISLSPHPRLQLDRLTIDHERAVTTVVNGLGLLLRRVEPGLNNFNNK